MAGDRRRFVMRQNLISIGDDYWIEDGDGKRYCEVDGKLLKVRKTLDLKDTSGKQRFKIQEELVRVRKTMAITQGGRTVAKVHKFLVSPIKDRFSIVVPGGTDMTAKGSILDHEYSIERDGDTVAEISKAWFRIRDTYGLELHTQDDPFLILAITVAIDAMCHDNDD